MDLKLLSALNAERAARRACVMVTDLDAGESRVVIENDIANDALAGELSKALRANKSGVIEIEGRRHFLTVQMPPVRVIILGAVHISQALAPMAKIADLDVTIIDPRTAFASPERFPDIDVIAEWPDAVLPGIGLDRYTAFVALTHDPKIDDMGLIQALRSECFYVGALGSRKSHDKRLARLHEAGLTAGADCPHSRTLSASISAQSALPKSRSPFLEKSWPLCAWSASRRRARPASR